MRAQKTKLRILGPIFALILLPGCRTTISNLSPQQIPENPSNIYTFSFEANFKQTNIERDTAKADIVINGERFQMARSDIGRHVFQYDYKIPPGVNKVKYYYILKYDYFVDRKRKQQEVYSDIFQTELINRYVIQLESNRAPVGAKVALVGRGFSTYDVLIMGGREVPTVFNSPNSLSFYVPSLPAGRNYDVALRTGGGIIEVGKFRVDEAKFTILPGKINLASGKTKMMVFTLDFEAPPGGLNIDVTTDIPDSVIMREVVVPEGARSVNVPVRGGEPGNGTLYVEAPGFRSVEVPVTIHEAGN